MLSPLVTTLLSFIFVFVFVGDCVMNLRSLPIFHITLLRIIQKRVKNSKMFCLTQLYRLRFLYLF